MQLTTAGAGRPDMGRAQEPGGDYGYDLAHQDVHGAAARAEDEPVQPTPASAQEDRSGDYGYDEAHDF
jgi:hypothetical protein